MTWQQQAACAGEPSFLSWPERQALDLCRRSCPVRASCAAWARSEYWFEGVAGERRFTRRSTRCCDNCGGPMHPRAHRSARFCSAPACRRASKHASDHRGTCADCGTAVDRRVSRCHSCAARKYHTERRAKQGAA